MKAGRSNIAAAINAAHAGVEAAKREGARFAVECGRLLVEAKETVPHGSWDAWLRLNTTVSPRTAQLYMRIARHVEGDPAKAQRVAGLTVREAATEAAGKSRVPTARPRPEPALGSLAEAWGSADDGERDAFARRLFEDGYITAAQLQRMSPIAQAACERTAEIILEMSAASSMSKGDIRRFRTLLSRAEPEASKGILAAMDRQSLARGR